ncbi:MAG: Stf0 family sulfotransferase [Pseudomonadota bacterium]
MPSDIKCLCVIGNQRSGTTAFRSFLESSGRFYDCGEIAQDADHVVSFPRFCAERDIRASDLLKDQKLSLLFDEFLNFAIKTSAGRFPVFDVKFNAFFATQALWRYPTDLPLFLRKLEALGTHFIFMYRKDLLEQVLSFYIAQHSDRWHNVKENEVTNGMYLDANECVRMARSILEAERICRIWFDQITSYEEIYYEGLFENENVSAKKIEKISSLFNIEFESLSTHFHRNLVKKRSVIENIQEIEEAFKSLDKVLLESSIEMRYSFR